MIGKKINQLATELAPASTDLTIIGNPTTGVSKKITLEQLGAIFSGAVSFYTNLAAFPNPGTINVIYCAKDTKKLYLWSGSAYVEVFPSQALLDTYQLRSEKGVSNGYASLDVNGKVPISQLPSSLMEYLGTWNAATNTPTLTNGTGDNGDVYLCNVAGTVNFGAGPITFAVGDWVIYNGSIWERSSGAVGTVTSVAASITGDAIGITGSPITTSGTLALAFAGNSTQYVNGAGNLNTFPTLLSSVGLSMPSAFSVANSPLTANGTIAVTGAGNATQYVRGDGQLATLPTNGGGGGASVSYYLNGSINQGTIGGVTYYEMNNTPIIGAGTDFSRSTNGYIASFLTDANDPALLNIPAGNWNFETYFQASSGGGSPTFYIELYKYDGTTFTLIASNSATPKLINDGANIEAYFSALAVPQTTLTLTDRLAVRIYVTTAGRTITLHTENGHLCQVITTFTTGLTALNGLTSQVQYLATGTSGTDFNISSATATHTFNLPTASATNRGALSSADWASFNSKQNAITLTTTGTSGAATLVGATLNIPNYAPDLSGYVPTSRTITINGTAYDLSANRSWSVGTVTSVGLSSATSGVTIGSTPITTSGTITLAIATASGSQQGLLSSTDWTTFNNKQSALTNPVTGSGTNNYIAKFTTTGSTIGNSIMSESGTAVSVAGNVQVNGDWSSTYPVYQLKDTRVGGAEWNIENGRTIGNLEFYNGAVGGTKLTLTPSGNLGLGFTPSASGTNTKALQLTNYGTLSGNGNIGSMSMAANAYESADNSWNRVNGTSAGLYQISYTGQHSWYYTGAASAGSAISWTQAMTLDASGRLGIGTTTPGNYGARLVSFASSGKQFTATNGVDADFDILCSSGVTTFGADTGTTAIKSAGTTRLTIASTGAATFSSSVTASGGASGVGFIMTNTTNARQVTIGYTSGAAYNYIQAYDGTNFQPLMVNGNLWVAGNANVGIGTTSPLAALDVNGNATLVANFNYSSSGTYVRWQNNGTSFGDVGSAGQLVSGGSTNDFAIHARSTYNMVFATNFTERMRITSGGNVEIATGSIKTGEPDTGWGRAAIKIGASVSGAAFNVTRYLPVSVDGTVYYINLNSSTP